MRIGKRTKVVGVLGAMLLVVAWLGVGCGDGGGEEAAEGPEEYASLMCEAMGKHADDLEALMGDEMAFEDPSEMSDFLADAGPVLEALANDLEKVKPPADIKDWHLGMVSGLSDSAELFGEMKDILDKPMEEALEEIEDLTGRFEDMGAPLGELGDLPAEYQEAFQNEPKCQELQDVFGELNW